ncbi:hypothetical protein PNEG_02052 [Pneumocystis murina B123]|uniref:Cation/H+ exchanger transmembrane domain-containing protein n=1 Tax=Pneumocystis murina (strain B123) TaxID=1069680 RepID=M7NMH5_PNEMU|nr:hypothetical protein PNEG_02052 [Pneumocystis murina B123]EMR09873.1 hypothetical protein PNEG_02052 [Pneumocystis murina B123]
MVWNHVDISKPHIAYAIFGCFTSLFMLVSLFIKQRLYIGKAMVATIVGIIFGPYYINIFDPDYNILEFSRIVLIVQVFAVGVEFSKGYVLKHWKSLVMLLCPVMIFGWVVMSVIVYLLVSNLVFIEALILGACVTATNPVLVSSIVGKSEFSKKIPEYIRNILSCESGCNDGFVLPFLFIGLQLLVDSFRLKTIGKFLHIKILYEVVFGCILGSFIGFSAGAVFSWDDWFSKKTEESHVSNVIYLLLNFAFSVYWRAIILCKQYNMPELGVTPWRLLIVAICPLIPDIHTWREAFFCGHFGPMGVGAIFVSVLAPIKLETKIDEPSESVLANPIISYYKLILMIWPITSFLILSSIIVHGSSVAISVYGKHLNLFSFTPTPS